VNWESSVSNVHTDEINLADMVRQKAGEIRMRRVTPGEDVSFVSFNQETKLISGVFEVETDQESVRLVNTPFRLEPISTQDEAPSLPAQSMDSCSHIAATNQGRSAVFQEGSRVIHDKFGAGTVIAVKKYGGEVRELDIGFDSRSDLKTLAPSFVKLFKS